MGDPMAQQLVMDLPTWPDQPRRSPFAVWVSEAGINAVAQAAEWWALWRYGSGNGARICTEKSSLIGDLVHIHCANRDDAEWLSGFLLSKGIHKAALKVIRTRCPHELPSGAIDWEARSRG